MADETSTEGTEDAATASTEAGTTASDLGDAGQRALKEERRRAREAVKERDALVSRLKEFEDRDKTELQKLSESHAQAEKRAGEAEATLARYRVATAKGLPPELVDRLRGTTEAELAEDADRLLELVGPRSAIPSFDGGARTTAPASKDMNALLRQAAGRQ